MKIPFLKLLFLLVLLLFASCAISKKNEGKTRINSIPKEIKHYLVLEHTDSTKINQLFNYKLFNRNGQIIEYKSWSKKGKLTSWDKRYYGKKNKFDSVVSFSSDGDKKSKNLYFYNLNNRLDSIKTVHSNGSLIAEQHNRYLNGKMISFRNKYNKSAVEVQTNYEYNQNGFLKLSKSFSKNNVYDSEIEYIRDNEGKILIKTLKRKNIIKKEYYKYDIHDNVVENKILDSKRKYPIIYTYSTENDKHSNWIKRITYQNNKIILKEERVINYY